MAPRVMIDGFNLALEQGTGVSTYARNLSYRLGALGAEVEVLYGRRVLATWSPLMREVAFFDDQPVGRRGPFQATRATLRMLMAGFGQRPVEIPVSGAVVTDTYAAQLPYFDRLWNSEELFNRAHNRFRMFKTQVPVRMASPPALMHWTYPLSLNVPGARNIYTLHDLVPLRLPFTTLDQKRRYFRLCRTIVQSADHIVTVSEASRADIINLLGCPPEKVTNTYQSVEIPPRLANKPMDAVRDELMGAFGLPLGGYHLFFGAVEPKKNLARLIEAYLASEVETPLVIVGKDAWKSEDELRLLGADHLKVFMPRKGGYVRERRVMRHRYAPFRLLVSLIRGAKAVFFPSLYEGFGLPALEAMSLGTPVMTSNTSSLPEVVGEAAVKVDPYDVRAMVEGIRALDRDAELRAHLSEAGRARAATYSAEAYERRLSDLYARLGVALPNG
ncbi:glycosyltransferase family 4 protein [Roseomonas sp. CCTCC AB2023176]|uniref:glycosyltransferase family 4 protein n=1 Tax=Roseomonas sp. CCTCC AB2023176 TaxID=3342640 RepID=UPI0035DFF614